MASGNYSPIPSGSGKPPTTLVTGLSGNVGRRLAALLKDRPVVAVDLFPPQVAHDRLVFRQLDLSSPGAVGNLRELIAEHNVREVVHLAFVLDPWRTRALTARRQREINIGGTQHLLEAVAQANQKNAQVQLVLYLSSVTSYGPDLPGPVAEDFPQNPRTYTYALHKKETDEMCRRYHPQLAGCALTIVRGHIFLGKEVDNFITNALRGRGNPHRVLGRCFLRWGWRLPLLLPAGKRHEGLYQFMHIDDAARVLAWLCSNYMSGELNLLNLQGRGPAVTGPDCARLAGLPLVRVPGKMLVSLLYRVFWAFGVSPVPPDALPYFTGSYVMDTTRLERLLGEDYERLVQYTSREAVLETVTAPTG